MHDSLCMSMFIRGSQGLHSSCLGTVRIMKPGQAQSASAVSYMGSFGVVAAHCYALMS